MRSRLILAVAGLLGAVGFAHAQSAPKQFAPTPLAPLSIHAAAPLPAEIGPIAQASARSTQGCTSCAGPVVAYGEGCAAPGSRTRHSHASRLFIGAGTINPVTCGCLASERTFVFGSCKHFFNPQLECGAGCGGCWPVDRRTPCQGVTSYLNR